MQLHSIIDSTGNVSVQLVFAKSRVSPIKPMTVPRLELTAAVLATRCSVMLEKEFKFSDSVKHFSIPTVPLFWVIYQIRRVATKSLLQIESV